jgi:hypothetical protein
MEITFVLAAIGLILFSVWLVPSPLSWFTRRALQKRHEAELSALRMHLHTRMEIDAEGLRRLKHQNERLKKIVQNLRITNHTLNTAPEQAELRLLYVYDRAIRLMERKYPIFVPTWRSMVAHAEREIRNTDQGFAAMVRRVFRLRGQPEGLPPAATKETTFLDADGAADAEPMPATGR